MSKDDAINIMTGSNLVDKRDDVSKKKLLYIKNEWVHWFNLLSKKSRCDIK